MPTVEESNCCHKIDPSILKNRGPHLHRIRDVWPVTFWGVGQFAEDIFMGYFNMVLNKKTFVNIAKQSAFLSRNQRPFISFMNIIFNPEQLSKAF